MEKTIDIIRKRCDEKLKHALQNNNQEEINKYETINNFLINDRCFLNINRINSINILKMLDFSEEDCYFIYEDLISFENIINNFVFEEMSKGGK